MCSCLFKANPTMDPSPFLRLTVGKLALKLPVAAKPARSAVHPSSSPCYCTVQLNDFPVQSAVVPFISPESAHSHDFTSHASASAASFYLSRSDLEKISGKSSLFSALKKAHLKISVYSSRGGDKCCFDSGYLLGKIWIPLDFVAAQSKAVVFHNGWINVGKGAKSGAQFHLKVKAEPDPRFIFQFDGDPECSPQIFQLQGKIRQPVFTCKFSFRSPYGSQRSRSLPPERGNCTGRWLRSLSRGRDGLGKERKGWSITIHDLSGSPVATASMVTPFVASPGSDRVNKFNPGCWLILRPGDGTWKPWGRLEAWREHRSADCLGYRFMMIPESAASDGIVLAESTLSCSKGGKFTIDLTDKCNSISPSWNGRTTPASSPVCSPRGSGDFGHGFWPYCMYKGFVMSGSIGGKTTPQVELRAQHVNCTEDAAPFVALAAALDLSLDACSLFSQKLRKELRPPT